MFKLKNRYMHFNRIFAVGVATAMSIVGVTFFAGDEEIHACSLWPSLHRQMLRLTMLMLSLLGRVVEITCSQRQGQQ